MSESQKPPSEEMDAYMMFTDYTIRYWMNKAKRAEQGMKREAAARKLAEQELERIHVIPKDIIEALISRNKVSMENITKKTTLDDTILKNILSKISKKDKPRRSSDYDIESYDSGSGAE